MASRCVTCGNYEAWCICTKTVEPEEGPTPFEQAVEAIKAEVAILPGAPDDYTPNAIDHLIYALGANPVTSVLVLCRKGCGVTTKNSCDYGGWHKGRDDSLDYVRLLQS